MMLMNMRLYLSTAIEKGNHDRSYHLKSLDLFVSTKKLQKMNKLLMYHHRNQTKCHIGVPIESRHNNQGFWQGAGKIEIVRDLGTNCAGFIVQFPKKEVELGEGYLCFDQRWLHKNNTYWSFKQKSLQSLVPKSYDPIELRFVFVISEIFR